MILPLTLNTDSIVKRPPSHTHSCFYEKERESRIKEIHCNLHEIGIKLSVASSRLVLIWIMWCVRVSLAVLNSFQPCDKYIHAPYPLVSPKHRKWSRNLWTEASKKIQYTERFLHVRLVGYLESWHFLCALRHLARGPRNIVKSKWNEFGVPSAPGWSLYGVTTRTERGHVGYKVPRAPAGCDGVSYCTRSYA